MCIHGKQAVAYYGGRVLMAVVMEDGNEVAKRINDFRFATTGTDRKTAIDLEGRARAIGTDTIDEWSKDKTLEADISAFVIREVAQTVDLNVTRGPNILSSQDGLTRAPEITQLRFTNDFDLDFANEPAKGDAVYAGVGG